MPPPLGPVAPPDPLEEVMEPAIAPSAGGMGFPSTADYGAQPIERVGPLRDPDAKEAARPKARWVAQDAEQLKGDHDLRLAQAREYAEWLDHTRVGYFEDDEEDIMQGIVEVMPLTTLAADHYYNCGAIAGMEVHVELAGRETTEGEEALAIEDACHFLREHEIRQYAKSYGSLLRWAEPNHLQRYGCLVGLDTINPDDNYCGLDMSLIDPLTVFPVWEGKNGLVEVFRVYEDTAANIIGNYGGRSGPEYERIKRKMNRIAGKDGEGRPDRSKLFSVIECWNRDWVQVVVDDEKELLTRRHGYDEVPFTIVIGGFDAPPGTSTGSSRNPYAMNTIWGEIAVNDGSLDLARQYRPYQWRKLKTHAIREATLGRMLTAFRDARNPTWVYEVDPMTAHLNTGAIEAKPGHIIEIPLGNRLNIATIGPDPNTLAPLLAAQEVNAEQGPWSQLRAGQIPPQTSDSALGTMLELGGADRTVLVQSVELFLKLRFEARLRRWRDWGPVLGRPNERGALNFPSRGYSSTPLHKLTQAMLERAGCEVHVTLHHWRPNPMMAQYMATLRSPGGASGMPLVSDETARKKLRVVADPDRERFRIEDEMLAAMPAVGTQRALRRLDAEIEAELAAGDDANADALMTAALELEWEREQQLAQGMANPAGAEGGGGGGMAAPPPQTPPPPPGGNGSPPNPMDLEQMGLSMPQVGRTVGQSGGAPGVKPVQPIGGGPRRG